MKEIQEWKHCRVQGRYETIKTSYTRTLQWSWTCCGRYHWSWFFPGRVHPIWYHSRLIHGRSWLDPDSEQAVGWWRLVLCQPTDLNVRPEPYSNIQRRKSNVPESPHSSCTYNRPAAFSCGSSLAPAAAFLQNLNFLHSTLLFRNRV